MSASSRPALSDNTIALALEILYGRPAEDDEVVALRGQRSLATLRIEAMRSEAFRKGLPRSIELRDGNIFALPLEIMREPDDPALPWRFAEPDLRKPVSQMTTMAQIGSPDYARWCGLLRERPRPSATQWANVWLLAMIEQAGLMKPGLRALGLDIGEEHIACLLARQEHRVLVTPRADVALADLHLRDFLPPEAFARQVASFTPEVPGAFDLVWSNGSVPRCGTLELALDMVASSITWLKPGGVALHVLGVTLSSDTLSPDTGSFIALRRQDLLHLAARLMAEGHAVWPINLHPGTSPIDAEVDSPSALPTRLKQRIAGHAIGTFGLAVRRGASPESQAAL